MLVSGPAHAASFTLNANGSFSYTPSANYNGPDSFTYRAKDPSGATSGLATVSITVVPVNDPPTVAVVAGGSCSLTNAFAGTITLTVADPDSPVGGLTLSASSSNPSVIASNGVSFGGSGGTRTATFTGTGLPGSSTVTLTVSDGSATGSATVTYVMGKGTNDVLTGGAGTDLIFGGAGNNTLTGGGGADLLCGGSGDDVLNGGDGDDTLDGGSGNDRLFGDADNDALTGVSGADFFSGGAGVDVNTDFNAAQGDTRDNT